MLNRIQGLASISVPGRTLVCLKVCVRFGLCSRHPMSFFKATAIAAGLPMRLQPFHQSSFGFEHIPDLALNIYRIGFEHD